MEAETAINLLSTMIPNCKGKRCRRFWKFSSDLSLPFFTWDIPWHGLRKKSWVGIIYCGCSSVLETEETSCSPSRLREKETEKKKTSWKQWLRQIVVIEKKKEKEKKIVEKCRRKLRTRKCRTSCVTRILADTTVKTTLVFPGILKTADSSVWA